ncbi:MAG: alpha/beta hydrolase, partial [Nitrospinae bacterium]|nr:alpha/beta hydrolase [Nitrospinota bacterium]
RRAGGDLYPWMPTAFVSDAFRSDRRVAALTMPKLFIHGTNDRVIPVGHTMELYENARSPRQVTLIDGGGHDDGYVAGGAEYLNGVGRWLDATLGPVQVAASRPSAP